MIRSEIRTRVRKKLGETTALFWTDAELNSWMEDAQKDIVWRAKLKRTRGTFTTVASTARYSLTAQFSRFLRVVDGGVWIYNSSDSSWTKLEYSTKSNMDALYGNWTDATTGTPIIYMEDSDENIIELYPTPDANSVGANYCRVYYCATPTVMTVDANSPDLDPQGILHLAVIDWVCATGFESRGYWDIANDCWTKYYDKIKTYLVEKNNKEDQEIVTKPERSL